MTPLQVECIASAVRAAGLRENTISLCSGDPYSVSTTKAMPPFNMLYTPSVHSAAHCLHGVRDGVLVRCRTVATRAIAIQCLLPQAVKQMVPVEQHAVLMCRWYTAMNAENVFRRLHVATVHYISQAMVLHIFKTPPLYQLQGTSNNKEPSKFIIIYSQCIVTQV